MFFTHWLRGLRSRLATSPAQQGRKPRRRSDRPTCRPRLETLEDRLSPTVVTSTTSSLPVTATSMTIAGSGFDTTAANDSVTFGNPGVTGTVTATAATSLTVSHNGLISLTGGTALYASVTVDGISSGSAVQAATIAPVVCSDSLACSLTTLASFNGANGFGPSGLVEDSSGNLFGTTRKGCPAMAWPICEEMTKRRLAPCPILFSFPVCRPAHTLHKMNPWNGARQWPG